ncbi:Stp1/IreP family PP2C-type Ser/Thr phosphatase [uncultured Allofournierella sp.]|uniref:Stp1/IreP family PP2C-type Ser/Thr phosphatase n=1 Tax=uncultured Allofournierella sp. TaxID=1940258 RepID=UPI00375248B9
MKLAGKTDVGSLRSENQDNYRAARLQDDTVWAVVCDGMGGAAAGKLAAQIATDTMEACFEAGLRGLQRGQERAFLQHCITQANRAIYENAEQEPENRGMGTTVVCCLVRQGELHIVHVGDSRAYLCRSGQLTQLTKDHSMVQQLVETGKLTSEEAENYPRKNLITRALGVERGVTADYTTVPVKTGDMVLLCSDGLTGMVEDEQILAVMQHTPFFGAPRRLIEEALKAGGQDNITAVLIEIEQPED